MPIIRKAKLRDVPVMLKMINAYADSRLLLPRTLADLSENIAEFTVAEEGGKVLGCGALKLYDDDIAEIRSLCVQPGRKNSGLGSALTAQILDDAEHRGLKTVFALTVVPEFFLKCGFHEAPREKFPMKIWRDCLHCPKLFHCDEKTVAIDVAWMPASLHDVRSERAGVSA